MTYLFSAWISHFIACVWRVGEISPEQHHLLILDGHNSHVTLEVVQKARATGLDLLSLQSHMSHALQPLDVCCFKPFKQHFREYRDFWSSRNRHQAASKEMLAHWVSLALKKALTPHNIQKEFSATRIYPLNSQAMAKHLAPSEVFMGEFNRGQDGANVVGDVG